MRDLRNYFVGKHYGKTLNNLFDMPFVGLMLWLVLHKAPKITMKVSHIILCDKHFNPKYLSEILGCVIDVYFRTVILI